jgi:hypothetical protein
LVIATAHIIDPTHGFTTITNFSAGAVSFFSALENPFAVAVAGTTYEVSAIPLPASFYMFAAGLMALALFAGLRKNRQSGQLIG